MGDIVPHLLAISMISGNDHAAISRQYRFGHPANTGINGFHCLDGGIKVTGMTHHVGIGKIHHNQIVVLSGQTVQRRRQDTIGAHFRSQIIGGDLG